VQRRARARMVKERMVKAKMAKERMAKTGKMAKMARMATMARAKEAGPGMERTTGRTLEEATMGREKTAITIGKLIRAKKMAGKAKQKILAKTARGSTTTKL